MSEDTQPFRCLRCGGENAPPVKSHILPKWAKKLASDPTLNCTTIGIYRNQSRVAQDIPSSKDIMCEKCENSFSEVDRRAKHLLTEPPPEYTLAWKRGETVRLIDQEYKTVVDFTAFTAWKYIASEPQLTVFDNVPHQFEDICEWSIIVNKLPRFKRSGKWVDLRNALICPRILPDPPREHPFIQFCVAGFAFAATPAVSIPCPSIASPRVSQTKSAIDIPVGVEAAELVIVDLRQRIKSSQETKGVAQLTKKFHANQTIE